jgi:hypothetical protein
MRLFDVFNVGEGIGAEFFEDAAGNVFQGGLMGGGKDDRGAMACIACFFPARSADAPAITGLKTGETVFEHRGAEIVPGGGGVCEEILGDQSANAVAAEIFGSGIAISGPVEPSEEGCATGLKGSTEDVLGCGIHPVTLAGRRVLRKASLGSACLRLHILLIILGE